MEGATALGDHRAGYGPGSPGHDAEVIRNAVIHLTNEQPLVADLPVPPSASDISLVCTNLRTLNGKRPVFADDSASLFVFPYAHIRFLEVPPASLAAAVELDVDSADGANGRSTGTAVAVIANAIAAAAVAVLGLAIALAHAQAQGGTLTATNVASGGACFTLSLQGDVEPVAQEPVSS